tara:strand:+ start:3060 stop:3881 length:822 start_codon:yes stop_codon:yes gene_type:complete
MLEIAVVIPTYNRITSIERTVDSVLNQSLAVNEIIIIDDGSNDGTKELIKTRYPQINYIYQSNKGVSAARNKGVNKTNCNWIGFLDSDDTWEPNKIEKQIEAIKNNPNSLICHTNETWYRNGKILKQQDKHKKYGGHIFNYCLPLCIISPSSVMIHKRIFNEIGLFDEKLLACEDYDMWLRICCKYPVLFIDETLTNKYGGHKDQLSKKYWGIDRFRIIALEKIIKSACLDTEQQNLAIDSLLDKVNIFLKGCEKYGENEYYERFKNIKYQYA